MTKAHTSATFHDQFSCSERANRRDNAIARYQRRNIVDLPTPPHHRYAEFLHDRAPTKSPSLCISTTCEIRPTLPTNDSAILQTKRRHDACVDNNSMLSQFMPTTSFRRKAIAGGLSRLPPAPDYPARAFFIT